MRFAAITMGGVHEPVERVLPRVLRSVQRAAREGVRAVLLPELVLGHYHGIPVAVDGSEVQAVSSCARETGTAVGVGIGEKRGEDLYSTYVLCGPDGSVAAHRKTRWQTRRCPISLGTTATAHDLLGLRAGVMICSETRFAEVVRSIAAAGADFIIMPHAHGIGGPNCQPLQAAIENVVAARCRETQLPAIVVAATGEGLQGGCALVNPRGEVVYQSVDERERTHYFQVSKTGAVALEAVAEPSCANDGDNPTVAP